MGNKEKAKKETSPKASPVADMKSPATGLGEDLQQVRTILAERAKEFNAILGKLQAQNEDRVKSITSRIKAIESGSAELEIKKKMAAKIGEYSSAILDENLDLKIKPEKARLKDLERLTTYFSVTDELLAKIETKISRTEEKSVNA